MLILRFFYRPAPDVLRRRFIARMLREGDFTVHVITHRIECTALKLRSRLLALLQDQPDEKDLIQDLMVSLIASSATGLAQGLWSIFTESMEYEEVAITVFKEALADLRKSNPSRIIADPPRR